MNCSQVEKVLWFYTENSLPQEQKMKVEQHLLICNSCNHLAQEFSETELLFKKKREVESNPFLYTRVMQHIENSSVSDHYFSIPLFLRNTVLVSLSVIGGVLLGINLLNHTAWSDKIPSQNQITMQEQTNEFLYGDVDDATFESYFEPINQDKP